MKSITFVRASFTIAMAFMTLFLVACQERTINQIMADPQRYANHEVGIVGNVVQSYSVIGKGVYQVDDGTGRLWVVSDKGVPRKGARVGVKGTIRDGFDLGSLVRLPEAIKSGLVMMESQHKAKY